MEGHRKKVKHYEQVRAVHELTFSCYKQMPLLTNDLWRRMLSESISRATANHEFDLIAFVFMPEHVHLLVLPKTTGSRISGLLKAIKRPYSYRIKQLLKQSKSELFLTGSTGCARAWASCKSCSSCQQPSSSMRKATRGRLVSSRGNLPQMY